MSYLSSRVAPAFAFLAVASVLVSWGIIGNYAAYIGAILSLFAFLSCAANARWNEVIRAPWVWCNVGAFLLIALAFSLQAGLGAAEAISAFIFFGLAPVFCVAVMPLAKTTFNASHLGWLFWAGSLAAAGWAVFMAYQGVYRGSAIELSPIHFADLAMICGFSSLVVLFDRANKWRWLVLTGPLFALVVLFSSETRAAVIVAAGLSAVCALFLLRAWHADMWKKVLVLVSLPVLGIAAFYAASLMGFERGFQAFDALWKGLTGDASLDSSAYSRLEQYRAGLLAFGDSPWIGHGWHAQISSSLEYMSPYAQELYAAERWGYIHNEFLSLTLSAGLFGSIAYCLLFAAPLVAVKWRNGRDDRLVFLAVITTLGVFISGLTDVLFSVEIPKVFLLIVASVLFALQLANREKSHNG